MSKVLLFTFILFCICFLIWLFFKLHLNRKKTNIHEFAIKDPEIINFKSLHLVIFHYFKADLKLIVLQDDIKFGSSNFYWPKNSIYIHMSDANSISNEQFISIMFSKSFEENISFLKSKIYIT